MGLINLAGITARLISQCLIFGVSLSPTIRLVAQNTQTAGLTSRRCRRFHRNVGPTLKNRPQHKFDELKNEMLRCVSIDSNRNPVIDAIG